MIKTLTLGYAGEYGARMMTIDLSEEAAMWPDAAAQLLLVRPGEHTPYPADNAVYADGCMTFTPTKADMAIPGQGYAQVYFYGADGNVLGKSSMMITHILASLGGDSTEPPSGDELGYYDKLMQQAALAIAAGESAKEDAQSAAESAAKAEAALEEMKNISTQSGNMPDGGSPGQILAKKSAENYDAHWIDPPSGSGTGGGVADSVAWGNVTDKPSTYPPAGHTHPEYLGKNETAANATQLNGKSASEYALKTDLPTTASDVGARPDTWQPNQINSYDGTSFIEAQSADGYARGYAAWTTVGEKRYRIITYAKPDTKEHHISLYDESEDTLYDKTLVTTDALYTVGSIYMSVNSTSPASLFGGAWERLLGKFLFGADDNISAGSTGGEEKHTLTTEEMPNHNHANYSYGLDDVKGNGWAMKAINSYDEAQSVWSQYNGGGQPHNNMPPYLAVYMWKRVY